MDVGVVPVEESEPAPRPAHRVDGDAGTGEFIEVAQDSALADFEFASEFCRCDSASLLQDEED
jgi:hypothetical protein